MVILTGTRGGTEAKGKTITGGTHVAFRFDYVLSDFGKLTKPEIPAEARKVLARN